MALLPMAVWCQKSSLAVTFTGLDAGARIVVSEPQGGHLVPIDTMTLDAKMAFKLERQTTEPVLLVMAPMEMPNLMLHAMLLPREKVQLVVDCRKSRGQLYLQSVKGSHNMEMYRRFNNLMCDAKDDPAQQSAMPDRVEMLIREYKTQLMSAFLVTYFESAFEQYAPLYKEVRDALIERYGNNEFVKHVDQKVRTAVMVGMDAPEIVMADTTGAMRRLSDLRGRVVLIDFWASWCRPCRAENPNVVRLYQKYHPKGFEVFSVSLDNSGERWKAAIKDDNLLWPDHVSDLRGWSSAAGRLYGVSSIPATVLVDRDGKVLARNLRGSALENKLKEIFGE